MLTHTDRRRFPGLRFPVPLVATLALLAILGALVLPATARAQTATTLVSNIGQGTDVQFSFATNAQRFTIGSDATASMYTLTGVDIVSRGSTAFTAKVCGVDSSGFPTSTCTELTAPATFAAGTMSFTAPSNTTLERGTTYTVSMSAATSGDTWGFGRTGNDAEDTGKATGWSIGNAFDFITTIGGTDTWTTSDNNSVRIAIKGYAVGGVTLSTDATLSALSVTGVTLDPSFASDTYAYTASVANDVEEVTVAPTTNHADATFEYLDSSDAALADADTNTAGHQVVLDVGDTVLTMGKLSLHRDRSPKLPTGHLA